MPVIDASVVIDWIAPGVATTAPAVKLLDRLARRSAEIVGPRLLFEEVSNALITGVRRRRWSGAAADGSYSLLARLPIRVTDDQRDLDRAWELARPFDLGRWPSPGRRRLAFLRALIRAREVRSADPLPR